MDTLEKVSVSLDIKNFICPITRELFYDPVIAEDGYIYERIAIEKWINENGTSPMTRERIKGKLKESILVKNILETILELYPDLKKEQYEKDNLYMNNSREIHNHIRNKNFTKLLDYIEYDIVELDSNLIDIFEGADDDTVIYVLDNSNIYDYSNIILRMIRYASPNIQRYMIQKSNINELFKSIYYYVDINTFLLIINETEYIHTDHVLNSICNYPLKFTKCIIDKYIELNMDLTDIFMKFIKMENQEILNYILDNSGIIDLKYVDEKNWTFLHFVGFLRYSDIFIKLVNLGANLNCISKEGWYPIHVACYYCNEETISLLLKEKNIDITVEIIEYKGDIVFGFGCIELLKFNKFLSKSVIDKLNNRFVNKLNMNISDTTDEINYIFDNSMKEIREKDRYNKLKNKKKRYIIKRNHKS